MSEIELTSRKDSLASLDQRPNVVIDNDVLASLGKRPVLKRNFGFMAMLGFSCTIMCTWEGVLLLFLISFSNGGSAGSIYGFILVWLGNLCVFATMGEMASMAPTAGGQYHWVSMLAPRSYQKFLSYLVGWINVTAWQANVSAGGFLAAGLIEALISLRDPTYVPKSWQTILLFYSTIFFAVFMNAYVRKALPQVERFILAIHVLGFFAVLIPLVVLAPKTSSEAVWTVLADGGNFGSNGLAFMVGLIAPVYSFLGADSAVHMSEEIHDAARIVPRTMLFSIAINGVLGLAMMLAVLYCLGNPEDVASFPYPFMEIFKNAAGTAGGTAMSSVPVILLILALIAFIATASRMTWSFARDQGLPGWKSLSKVNDLQVPLVSIVLTLGISMLLALIILGSSVAFNDVLSLTVSCLYLSYLIGNTLLLIRRRRTGSILAHRRHSTALTNVADPSSDSVSLTWGVWRIPEPLGTIVNVVGCLYMAVILFFSFWPAAVNPGVQGMNYSLLMLGSVILLASIYYLAYAHKVYKGPVIEIR